MTTPLRCSAAFLRRHVPWLRKRRVVWHDDPAHIDSLRVDGVDYFPRDRFDHHLFICGLHRSGTTLLERYLASRFRVCCLRANTPESEGQHMQSVYPPAFLHGGPGRFAFAPGMRPAPPPSEAAPELRRRLLACWANYTVGDEPILLEKSPPNLTRIDWLRAVFPGAKFIILMRDPRAVAAATSKWSGQSFEELVFHWNVAHSLALDQVRDSDCAVMKYESFCQAPDEILNATPILADLPRRATPLPLEPRFLNISDANAKYLATLPARNYGRGAWDEAGYAL